MMGFAMSNAVSPIIGNAAALGISSSLLTERLHPLPSVEAAQWIFTMEKAKVVLITGASTGIGKATALELKRRGWRVFATVRKGSDVLDLTKAGRGMIEPLVADVRDAASINRALATIQERAGRLDALVNNAGIAVPGPLELLTDEQLTEQLDINILGVHRTTRAALPLLRTAKGRIVMVSSVMGRTSMPFAGAYATSKYGLEGYSDALRRELKGQVQVITIAPGSVVTPIWDKAFDNEIGALSNEDYPRQEMERLLRFFYKQGQRGITSDKVAISIADALELPWVFPRWTVAEQPLIHWLLEVLPLPISDWLISRVLRWPLRS
jgi:NAD(P)-dependent dehydrogenase (short-subunit alcohol dehydrogenase family)